MKLKYLCVALCLLANCVFAMSQNDISTNINNLSIKINQISQDLNKKQIAQKNIDEAIGNTDAELNASKQLLNTLQVRHDEAVTQSQQISGMLMEVTTETSVAESDVQASVLKIYQQLNVLQNRSNSILSGNDELQNSRKKEYLLHLLKAEQNKSQQLQTKLKQLNLLQSRLANQVQRLNRQMAQLTQQNHQLQIEKSSKVKEKQVLTNEISSVQTELVSLKQAQAELNHVLAKLARAKRSHGAQGANTLANQADMSYENNSPFLERKLVRPVDGNVTVSFGDMRNGVRSNGVLFKANNTEVRTISGGRAIYLGQLPGIGQIVVVDNGDNYVSIYGGVIPTVKVGDKLAAGQAIANAGTSNNQPMGGVYFELRHLGRPVNPSSIL